MSTQHKLTKKRTPRVNITYDLEVGDSIQKKELPFVVGVIGEFSEPNEPFKERKFTKVNKENFNFVMAGLDPSLTFNVENKLTEQGGYLNVNLHFHEMNDFSPESIALSVEPLRNLLEARRKLSDLKIRALSNEMLREHLESLSDTPEKIVGDNVSRIEENSDNLKLSKPED
jgi:type VI secretion system protein ImpB